MVGVPLILEWDIVRCASLEVAKICVELDAALKVEGGLLVGANTSSFDGYFRHPIQCSTYIHSASDSLRLRMHLDDGTSAAYARAIHIRYIRHVKINPNYAPDFQYAMSPSTTVHNRQYQ